MDDYLIGIIQRNLLHKPLWNTTARCAHRVWEAERERQRNSSSSCSWRVRHVILFLDPQDEVGPSISSSVVLCSFVLLVYIVVLVLIVCLCPSSVHAVATSRYCFISFAMFCAPVFRLIHWFFSLSSFVIPSRCLKNVICAASKRCSSLFFSTQTSLPNFNAA